MFPLKDRILIRGAQGHLNAGLGIGADYRANYVPFVIPFDGVVSTYWGKQGGNWLRLTRPNGHKIELAHLQSYAIKSGKAKAGQAGGNTGNTGGVTDFPHLHIQIFDQNGRRLDPEKYDWEDSPSLKTTFMKITLVANNNNWSTLAQKLATVNNMFKQYSGGKLETVFDIRHVNYPTVPFQDFNGGRTVDIEWYRKNVTPYSTGEITVLLLNPDQWQGVGNGGDMSYGDNGKAVRITVTAIESNDGVFEERVFHEICHAIFFLTGQRDWYKENWIDKWVVHDYLYQNPPKYGELLNLINYQALQNKLVNIKPTLMNQTKIVVGKDGKTVYKCVPVATDFEAFKAQASVEGIIVPNPIPKAADVL